MTNSWSMRLGVGPDSPFEGRWETGGREVQMQNAPVLRLHRWLGGMHHQRFHRQHITCAVQTTVSDETASSVTAAVGTRPSLCEPGII